MAQAARWQHDTSESPRGARAPSALWRAARSPYGQRAGQAPRAPRTRRGASRGQTMIIFALSLTVLIALLGLAVDSVRVFDLYARMERAAEAGALAGVIYMPNYYVTAEPAPGDGQSAASRAILETVKDGFGTPLASPNTTAAVACPTPPTSIPVAVCISPNSPTDLTVTITQTISIIFLGAIGAGPATISASATAEYLPSIHLGARTNYFGDQVECSAGGSDNTNSTSCAPNVTSQNHLQYFMANINGPAELKEEGDPFVYCAEGPANIGATDPNATSYTYNGVPTDHAQWPDVTGSTTNLSPITQHCGVPQIGGAPGNPDQQPSGFDGPATANTAHPGGYNYGITVESSNVGSVWIYNANYVPQDITFNGTYPLDHFIDDSYYTPNYYQGPAGGGIGGNFDGQHRDAPLFYFTTTYSLYSANNLFDRSTDQLITSVSYPPYDDTSADLRLHGCGSGQVYNPIWDGASTPNAYYNPSGIVPGQGCVPRPPCSLQWCQISLPAGLAPGTYRLVVETTGLNASTSAYTSTSTDGWGSHAYSVKVCDGTGLSTPVSCSAGTGQSHGAGQYNDPGVSVYGWNNMDIIVQQPLSQQTPNSQYPQTSCISSNATPYACVDLACLSSAYAGRTFTIELYDPGDGTGSGNLYIGIVPPPGLNATIAYPSYATTTTIDGDTVVQTAQSSYRPFNGLWLSATVSIPSSYSGDCFDANTGWWQLVYAGSSSMQPTDVLAVQATLVGSPVHLV